MFKTVYPQRTNQVIREAFIAKHLVKNRQKHIRILPSIYNGKWQKTSIKILHNGIKSKSGSTKDNI